MCAKVVKKLKTHTLVIVFWQSAMPATAQTMQVCVRYYKKSVTTLYSELTLLSFSMLVSIGILHAAVPIS